MKTVTGGSYYTLEDLYLFEYLSNYQIGFLDSSTKMTISTWQDSICTSDVNLWIYTMPAREPLAAFGKVTKVLSSLQTEISYNFKYHSGSEVKFAISFAR